MSPHLISNLIILVAYRYIFNNFFISRNKWEWFRYTKFFFLFSMGSSKLNCLGEFCYHCMLVCVPPKNIISRRRQHSMPLSYFYIIKISTQILRPNIISPYIYTIHLSYVLCLISNMTSLMHWKSHVYILFGR